MSATILTDEQIDALFNECMFGPDPQPIFARAIEQAVLQSPEVQAWKRDSELLNAIQSACWDVRFRDSPNGDAGDSSIGIEIVAHFMGKPHERVIGENYTEDLRAALEQAMTADAYPPARPEYEDDSE